MEFGIVSLAAGRSCCRTAWISEHLTLRRTSECEHDCVMHHVRSVSTVDSPGSWQPGVARRERGGLRTARPVLVCMLWPLSSPQEDFKTNTIFTYMSQNNQADAAAPTDSIGALSERA